MYALQKYNFVPNRNIHKSPQLGGEERRWKRRERKVGQKTIAARDAERTEMERRKTQRSLAYVFP